MKPSSTIESTLYLLKRLIPVNFFKRVQPIYHYLFAFIAGLVYRFPSRQIKVIAVTGTKGKTSTTEIISAILEEAGYRTAVSNTLRFKIGEEETRNFYRMTTPGRFFMQRFLRRAVRAKCDWAILEITSEGSRQSRHRFIDFNALVFTNLSPEHIESHGSFEKYLNAKLSIARALSRSDKRPRIMIANADDKHSSEFLAVDADIKTTYSIKDAVPYTLEKSKIIFNFMGTPLTTHMSGLFNLSNIFAGISFARAVDVSPEVIRRAIEKFRGIRGRVEQVNVGQDFDVIVDYAHTIDSLEKVYEVFQDSRKICVFGGAGGGRDTWKRPAMGAVASAHCDEIILTKGDPYDEDPMEIINDIMEGIPDGNAEVIVDRRLAIASALAKAHTGDTVIITGKGTDPYIMGPNGTRIQWDDVTVAKEELEKLGFK